MERLFVVLLLFLQLILAPSNPSLGKTAVRGVATDSAVLVSSVVDGDTFHVVAGEQKETIRVLGIDTPEVVDPRKPVQCFGREASAKAKELLRGKLVTLTADPSQADKDRYGRLLRYVTLPDGTDYGLRMITEGFAHEYTYQGVPHARAEGYKQAEKEAREKELGLWSPTSCP